MDADTETLICICCGHDFEAEKPVSLRQMHNPLCGDCNDESDDEFFLEVDDEEY